MADIISHVPLRDAPEKQKRLKVEKQEKSC